MGSPWRLREGFATSSRALHEDVAGAEGFAKAPRAPPFGNDLSDNDKPPFFWCPYMAINVNVQYSGGFLPDIILLTQ